MVRSQNSQFFDHVTGAFARFGRFVAELNAGLVALHRVQFDTPWKPVQRPTYGEW